MAKKEKIELTPEERLAKEERKKTKRKIFGETFLKACALFLAVVFVYSVTYVAFGKGRTVYQGVQINAGTVAVGAGGGSVSSGPAGSSSTGNSTDMGAAQTPEQADQAAEAAKAINAATAAAVKAGYTWTRSSTLNKVDVGGLERFLNPIIKGLDENATIESVVAGFVGAGGDQPKTATIKKGEDAAAVIDYHGDSYKLKATTLEPGDLKNLKVDGDTYTFTLEDATTPKRDGSTALNRLTDDIVIQSEVAEEIKGFTSAITVTDLQGVYSNINVKVVIKDGKLVELSYSYHAEVTELGLKAVVTIHGKGDMDTKATYNNFVY